MTTLFGTVGNAVPRMALEYNSPLRQSKNFHKSGGKGLRHFLESNAHR